MDRDSSADAAQIDKVDGLCAVEIGGSNGIINVSCRVGGRLKIQMLLAATLNVPVIDGDFMGRAYPTGWQTTPNVYDLGGRGENMLPACISSGDGNVMVSDPHCH